MKKYDVVKLIKGLKYDTGDTIAERYELSENAKYVIVNINKRNKAIAIEKIGRNGFPIEASYVAWIPMEAFEVVGCLCFKSNE